MADPNVQDINAGTTTEEAPATQQELPPTIESQPSDAFEVNGAAGGAPAEPLPADAAEPISPDNLPASEAPAPDAQDSAASSDVAQAEPAADATTEAAPATGSAFATNIGMEAPASEAVTGPSFGASDSADAAPSEPAADAAPAGAQPDSEAEAPALAPGADASDIGGALSPLPESAGGESPAPAGELSTTSTESQSPPEEAAAEGEGDKELPYNNVGMAQLGTAGIDEAGAPVEHPAPATTPAPIDPTTGNQLGEEDHKAVTGGEDYKEILSVKGPEDTDAANGVVAEHPAPAKTPTPIDPTSGLPLSEEDHKTVTGGLEKGTEVEVPVAPVNTDDGKAVDGGAATGATDGIPSAFSGSDAGNVSSVLGDEDGDDFEGLGESGLDEIKAFIEQKFNSVFHKLKHLEHEMHEALRSKKRR